MTKRQIKQIKIKADKPTLIKVGRHFINIRDVGRITEIRRKDEETGKKLYLIKFVSDPNPKYPCWVTSEDIGFLIDQFNVLTEE